MLFSKLLLLIFLMVLSITGHTSDFPSSDRSQQAVLKVEGTLKQSLSEMDLRYGAPIFIRIFKDPGVLEIWVESDKSSEFELFKSYPICTFSGRLGPKLKQGDWQSPEGFYFVTPGQLNPWSKFHLSFNLGYPNAYDRYHGRTGSALMVHGSCVSIGCYAMTDAYMAEIYALSEAALKGGQPFFRVHIFPFVLTEDRLENDKNHQWHAFWKNLKTGYDYFEQHKRPPDVQVDNGHYVFSASE